jgi:hypothetical protein
MTSHDLCTELLEIIKKECPTLHIESYSTTLCTGYKITIDSFYFDIKIVNLDICYVDLFQICSSYILCQLGIIILSKKSSDYGKYLTPIDLFAKAKYLMKLSELEINKI